MVSYTLTVEIEDMKMVMSCLNPCCNGRWSRTLPLWLLTLLMHRCLNPCCNGRWSRTRVLNLVLTNEIDVLILVVMEDGLVLASQIEDLLMGANVLILVVMEDGLVQRL